MVMKRLRPSGRLSGEGRDPFRPFAKQIKAWRKANRKMGWGIGVEEFEAIPEPPPLTEADRAEGFVGLLLCYGFGHDGRGGADAVLSGRLAWELAKRRRKGRIWQCEYADFDKPENIRLRPEAPVRPRGFYVVKFHPGREFKGLTVAKFRRRLGGDTGCGPEGLQLLAVTHPHFAELMNRRRLDFFALADYDIAPHGFNDFYEAPQIFCSQGILGLGVGNVDGPYPLFAIPRIRFPD